MFYSLTHGSLVHGIAHEQQHMQHFILFYFCFIDYVGSLEHGIVHEQHHGQHFIICHHICVIFILLRTFLFYLTHVSFGARYRP